LPRGFFISVPTIRVRAAVLKRARRNADTEHVASDAATRPVGRDGEEIRRDSLPARSAAPDAIRVYVVDDHELFRNGLCGLLAHAGIDVVGEAGDGEAACAAVPPLAPDVVVMDLDLPGISGLEATRRLARSAPEAGVIAFAMASDSPSVTGAIAAGVRGYVLKDSPPADIVAAVRAAAAGESPVSARAAASLFEHLRADHGARERHERTRPALTAREVDVLSLLVDGMSNLEIADRLCISAPTVKHHISSILDKLGVENRLQAAVQAVRERIV
jgi:DNA-binding NarL/FixJ family response regulator